MITNKAILGFFVILILVVLAVVVVRRNPNFLARFTNRTNPNIELNVNASPTPSQVAGSTTTSPGQSSGLIQCTPELKSACAENDMPVCGQERVVVDGTETTRSLTFKSACSYCKLYGTDDVLDLGDEKYYPLGYTAGACTVSK